MNRCVFLAIMSSDFHLHQICVQKTSVKEVAYVCKINMNYFNLFSDMNLVNIHVTVLVLLSVSLAWFIWLLQYQLPNRVQNLHCITPELFGINLQPLDIS